MVLLSIIKLVSFRMKGVQNNPTSVSTYLILKWVLFWFLKGQVRPFPLFSFWDPFVFSFTVGMWTCCSYQMSHSGRMGTLMYSSSSRRVSDSLWGERKVPGMCYHQKKAQYSDWLSEKMPGRPSNPTGSFCKWRSGTQNEVQNDFDFLRPKQNVGTAWRKERTLFSRLCSFPEF